MSRAFIPSMLLLLGFLAPFQARSASGPIWNMELLREPPAFKWLDDSSPIRSLAYQNEPYQGQPTEVFAFYATPVSVGSAKAEEGPFPGIVLIHGGGGTAFAEWAWKWARRGYCAIAMDLSGRRPPPPSFNPQGQWIPTRLPGNAERVRMPHPGPDQSHMEKFNSIQSDDPTDHWPFHAVAAAIRAHSLIRSFPEVDRARTAVTGISWGGYTTCITASIDDRFSAAVPVYGCGFLHVGESVQKPSIDQQGTQAAEWVRRYDPSSHLSNCRVPILFVNGTHDIHYPLDSYRKSYDLVPGPKSVRLEFKMRHSHQAGWEPEDIHRFIDQHCGTGMGIIQLETPELSDKNVRVAYQSPRPLRQASLHFTEEAGPLKERSWRHQVLEIQPLRVTGPEAPKTATVWYVSVEDDRGSLISTPPIFPGN